MIRRSFLRRLVTLAAAPLALAALSCVTPTIPLPPPSPELGGFEVNATEGTATFRYGPQAEFGGAVVYVLNATEGEGTITTADATGRVVTAPFPGREGDEVRIVFEKDEQRAGLCLLLSDGPSNSGRRCQ